jgi:hypothetical protein
MAAIGVINAGDVSKDRIVREVLDKSGCGVDIKFVTDPDTVFEFLNYEMPEIVIIDFSNKNQTLDIILQQIGMDPWLNSFAIIGMYDSDTDNEEAILERCPDINLVNLVEYSRAGDILLKTIAIINENRQIIFHRDLTSRLLDHMNGSFEIDNDPYAVSCYSSLITIYLYNNGFIDSKGKNAAYIALNELIMNGIEHGNCGITFEEKSRFLEKESNIGELIALKCRDPVIAARHVHLEYSIRAEKSAFTLRDEGPGFDWRRLKNPLEGSGIFRLHGRGILMTKHFVNDLEYNDKGNEVIFSIRHQAQGRRGIPLGFAGEEVLTLKAGDAVFQQDEAGDHLYYISSGKYVVLHNGKQVGVLSPADIFLGEMSFLLDNRRSATVRAETDGCLVKISKRAFVSVVKKYPHYGIYLAKILSQKLIRANEQAAPGAFPRGGDKFQPL